MIDIKHLVVTDPDIAEGKPVFVGTDVPVERFFDYLEAGDNIDNFIKKYRTVGRAEAEAVLSCAREMITSNAGKRNK